MLYVCLFLYLASWFPHVGRYFFCGFFSVLPLLLSSHFQSKNRNPTNPRGMLRWSRGGGTYALQAARLTIQARTGTTNKLACDCAAALFRSQHPHSRYLSIQSPKNSRPKQMSAPAPSPSPSPKEEKADGGADAKQKKEKKKVREPRSSKKTKLRSSNWTSENQSNLLCLSFFLSSSIFLPLGSG
jgi:hypothetical protein